MADEIEKLKKQVEASSYTKLTDDEFTKEMLSIFVTQVAHLKKFASNPRIAVHATAFTLCWLAETQGSGLSSKEFIHDQIDRLWEEADSLITDRGLFDELFARSRERE